MILREYVSPDDLPLAISFHKSGGAMMELLVTTFVMDTELMVWTDRQITKTFGYLSFTKNGLLQVRWTAYGFDCRIPEVPRTRLDKRSIWKVGTRLWQLVAPMTEASDFRGRVAENFCRDVNQNLTVCGVMLD